MTEPNQVKITLITGYLGAGKTTILNHILTNTEGIRAAVIVNDIGEINVDASLIKDGGLNRGDEVIPLTNGCACCSLADDLSIQLADLSDSGNFDYIFIEASGICEPIPITYNISALCNTSSHSGTHAHLHLDNIVAMVDCARMYDEFHGGKDLLRENLEEEDIENLLIQQIEFCSTLVLNKTDLVSAQQLAELKAMVRGLQREAVIVEAEHAQIPMSELVDTGRFDFDRAYRSAAWIDAMEHPEEHEDPEVLEYGISTFVYERRQPFDAERFQAFVASWPQSIIRVKGKIWLDHDPDMGYVFEQAGKQVQLYENGMFSHAFPKDVHERLLDENPEIAASWDPVVGDRITQLCFIGRGMERSSLEEALNACLTSWEDDR
ncbi:GTP-binding protein [Collinsella sp. AGMB00827]|uniref:GTP-binding protein n=1 Tax=Collinsella ureilytica TaxID=2869515 RepID=A0ABS7ML82_9ACTN|nr:GTP-binding protein [Collinsella urealyticum]MBY4798124.1 GTP-binding protein [Collinsella urealyticum]